MDLKSYGRWYDYSRARDAMFAATDTAWAPWYVAHTDDKKRGRLNIISHLLSQIPYEPLGPTSRCPSVKRPATMRSRSWSCGTYQRGFETRRHAQAFCAPARRTHR